MHVRNTLDRYELVRVLGQGGYGTVHEAVDRTTGQRVAVKSLARADAATIGRFKREFRAVQHVHHPNLVRLDALFEQDGQWHIAMELVHGVELMQHVRPQNEGFHIARVRRTFKQLAEALIALHAASIVHRDLKPNNVRVTPEGRAVLLDFGLATSSDSRNQSTQAMALGTVAYMAPEQAAGEKLGPAADWYAFGACLYETLTGSLPIEAGSALAMLIAKQRTRPVRASERAPDVPPDLDALCASLLAVNPQFRPTGAAVLSAFAKNDEPTAHEPTGTVADVTAFVGRERELDMLEVSFARARNGTQQIVLVEGESGIGKSELVDKFVRALPQRTPGVLVLRSRCHENEQLAYKAFDGAIDGLARTLARLELKECEALLPQRAGLLCRLFPTLATVKTLAALAAAQPRVPAAELAVQRSEALGVLSRLLTNVNERRPVVMVMDDLQWADAESFRLLRALADDPRPAPILIVATIRPQHELEGEAVDGIATVRALPCARTLTLSGLTTDEARSMAHGLLGASAPARSLDVIAEESRGHPLFLSVLARFAERSELGAAGELTLDMALAARIGALSPEAKQLLEVVAVAGTPQPLAVCARIAGVTAGETAELVAGLCAQKLLRRRRTSELACYHNRIRRAVIEGLSVGRARTLHAGLARELEKRGTDDPAEIARHYDAAGETHRALEAYRLGAERATTALAFERAAALYARVLELATSASLEPAALHELRVTHAHALARAGRSAEAASEFMSAAEAAKGDERVRLLVSAAQHLLQSGKFSEGLATARVLLTEIGASVPTGRRSLHTRLSWDRAWLKMTGLSGSAQEQAASSDARVRLDAVWDLALPLSWIDPLLGAALNTSHLRRALDCGDPLHLSRALSLEASYRALERPDRPEAFEGLLVEAQRASALVGDADAQIVPLYLAGLSALYAFQLPRATEQLERAAQQIAERCRDQPWLLSQARANLALAWMHAGQHARLATHTAAWLDEARGRGDRFGIAALTFVGQGTLRALMDDDPQAALAALDESARDLPPEPFAQPHWGELAGSVLAMLYAGGSGAWDYLNSQRARAEDSFFMRSPFAASTLLTLSACAGLSALGEVAASERPKVTERVYAEHKRLARLKSPAAALSGALIGAQLAITKGRLDEALGHARTARTLGDAQGALLRHPAAYLEGLLQGGPEGSERCATALAFFAEQGYREPRRAVALYCPLAPSLEARPR